MKDLALYFATNEYDQTDRTFLGHLSISNSISNPDETIREKIQQIILTTPKYPVISKTLDKNIRNIFPEDISHMPNDYILEIIDAFYTEPCQDYQLQLES